MSSARKGIVRSAKLCLDASFLLKLALEEEDSDVAKAHWAAWREQSLDIVAPPYLLYEASSVVLNHVHRRTVAETAGFVAFRALRTFAITYLEPDGMYERAWQMAKRFRRPTLYDAYYLALADMLGCELWTASRRVYTAVHAELPWVRLLGSEA